MKLLSLVLVLPAMSLAGTPCDQVVAAVQAKIKAEPTSYSLKVTDGSVPPEYKVIGRCEGGRKKIIYHGYSGWKTQNAADYKLGAEYKNPNVDVVKTIPPQAPSGK